jgi:anti-anti-sigma regulatory factor
MNFKVSDSKKEGRLTIGGALTIQRSAELKEILLKAMTEVDSITIQFDRVTDVDLSCMQMLCAAHKTSMRIQKKLRIDENQTDILQKAFKDAGFSQLMKCKNTDDSGHCVWFSGGSHE